MPPSAARRRWSLTRYFAVVSVVAMAALGCALVWVTSNVMRGQALRDGTASAETLMAYTVGSLPSDAFADGLVSPEEQARVDGAANGFGDRLVEVRLWSATGTLMYSSTTGARPGFPDNDRFAHVQRSGVADAQVLVDLRDHEAPGDGGSAMQRQVLDVYVPVRASDTAGPRHTEGGAAPADAAAPADGAPADGAPADEAPAGEASPATTGDGGTPEGADATGRDEVVGAAEILLDHTASEAALSDAVRTVGLVVGGGLVALWLLLFRTVFTTSRRLQSTALENARLALLDSLTGLPNRRLLAERMLRTVTAAHEDGSRVGLVLLDIDRFKDINDSLGHDRGDELLEQVAERLRGALRDEDVVARLGGDEFAILLPDVRSIANAERLARRVRALFVPPFTLGELSLHVETSVGVACLPDHAHDPSSLMRTADVAMYAAKHHRTGVSVYSADEDDSSPARLVLLGDLHHALDTEPDAEPQLEMHYQPKIDLNSGKIVGLEALMRWRHPTRGLLGPGMFIPLAEQSGLIHDVTRFALSQAVAQLARWRDEGRVTPVAVNLSAHDVTTSTVVDVIEGLLERHGVPPELLEVEITETALVADPSRVVPVLQRLGTIGVKVAIDDFGIGNTSIAQLRDLPVDELKIDRLFVADLRDGGRAGSEVVVQAMVDLAHSFDLRVVAEGVEDQETATVLRRLGVDQAQGFWYSPAVPAALLPTLSDVPRQRRARPPAAPAAPTGPGRAESATGSRGGTATARPPRAARSDP
ncbi:putative bifunctional diguanylate cyclase/phosphodiesterase [Cellulomonas sp. URHB0016]